MTKEAAAFKISGTVAYVLGWEVSKPFSGGVMIYFVSIIVVILFAICCGALTKEAVVRFFKQKKPSQIENEIHKNTS